MAVPCVYQFHHLGKNNPSLSGDGFFMRAPGMARSAVTGAVPVHVVVAG